MTTLDERIRPLYRQGKRVVSPHHETGAHLTNDDWTAGEWPPPEKRRTLCGRSWTVVIDGTYQQTCKTCSRVAGGM